MEHLTPDKVPVGQRKRRVDLNGQITLIMGMKGG
jgi:hypothetical protein